MAHKTEIRHRCCEGKDAFFLCMGSRMARSTAMLHADILIERGMDYAFRDDLLVAIDACLFRSTG